MDKAHPHSDFCPTAVRSRCSVGANRVLYLQNKIFFILESSKEHEFPRELTEPQLIHRHVCVPGFTLQANIWFAMQQCRSKIGSSQHLQN